VWDTELNMLMMHGESMSLSSCRRVQSMMKLMPPGDTNAELAGREEEVMKH
jgi:hypothetical protein